MSSKSSRKRKRVDSQEKKKKRQKSQLPPNAQVSLPSQNWAKLRPKVVSSSTTKKKSLYRKRRERTTKKQPAGSSRVDAKLIPLAKPSNDGLIADDGEKFQTKKSSTLPKKPLIPQYRVRKLLSAAGGKPLEEVSDQQLENPLSVPFHQDDRWTKYVAMDCEMVGVGKNGMFSQLAQVCIVNSFGVVIYHKYVQPQQTVIDYRTKHSGLLPHHLSQDNPHLESFQTVQKDVSKIIKNRIVVGHGLRNDFKVLDLAHPASKRRDTATYKPLLDARSRPRKLRWLAEHVLGVSIQKILIVQNKMQEHLC
mmetsp:Transcript_10506/g.15779  ORF Transcript_10506/g.15779 Transcript_10506/m.15779 type:complete len:307 (-) Transcript_10506:99-1019(-)